MTETNSGTLEFWKKPKAEEVFMLVGFRQWADAGSVSSGLPQYLVQQTRAEPIGKIRPNGFYLFQVPGTHDLMRPVVRFNNGFPESLEMQHNDFYQLKALGDKKRQIVLFLGDEPHMNVELYVDSLLQAARTLNIRRIVGFGGVYGELPYDKERMISANYSMPRMRDELANLGVSFSDYHGGASIGSVICKRANEQGIEYAGLYALVPAYDFSMVLQDSSSIRIENDFFAWLGVMRRVNYMLKIGFDLSDLESKSRHLVELVESKIEELENASPQLGVREYMRRLSEEFQEPQFNPLDDVWEEELKRLLNKFDDDDDQEAESP